MTMPEFVLNCSSSLSSLPLVRTASRARELGYTKVEYWWPFASDSPNRSEVRAFVDSVLDADAEAVLLNFPGGGSSANGRGLLALPGRERDFFRGARRALDIGRELGVTRFNPMVGNVWHSWSRESREFRTAVSNIVNVAPLANDLGATLVLEPLSGFPGAPLKRYGDALELVIAAREAGPENVAVLLDLYHAARNQDEVLASFAVDSDMIGHVQIADAPGRGWPGTGELPLAKWIQLLASAGYRGPVGLESIGDPIPAAELSKALLPAS